MPPFCPVPTQPFCQLGIEKIVHTPRISQQNHPCPLDGSRNAHPLRGWHPLDGVKGNFGNIKLLFLHFSYSYQTGMLSFLFINPFNQKEFLHLCPGENLSSQLKQRPYPFDLLIPLGLTSEPLGFGFAPGLRKVMGDCSVGQWFSEAQKDSGSSVVTVVVLHTTWQALLPR
jgi:hypothetical protein